MRRRGKGGKTVRAQRRKTLTRRNAPKAGRGRRSLAAGKEPNVARLTRERDVALEQQAATADVLKVISRSTFDLQPVLDTLVNSAARLCHAERANISLLRGGTFHYLASVGFSSELMKHMQSLKVGVNRGTITGRAVFEGKVIHVPDVFVDPEFAYPEAQRLGKFRSALGVPLMREGVAIGAMFLSRERVEPFSQNQIRLIETFADQAVIAIENARLLSELRESLQQQTATTDVLTVISSSPGELEPVFKAMLESALRICEAEFGMLMLHHSGDGSFDTRVMVGAPPALVDALLHRSFTPPPGNPLDRILRTKKTVHIVDAAAEKAKPLSAQLAGARSHITVPMVKQNEVVGAIAVYRTEVRPFTDKQIELVSNFAAQAVIAIENTRLFSELRESLAHQTATSEILASISGSMTDAKPVFNAIVRNLLRLFGTRFATVQLFHDGMVEMPAADGGAGIEKLREHFPRPLNEDTVGGQAMVLKRVVQVSPLVGNPLAPAAAQQMGREFGYNSIIAAPMTRQDKVIGAIVCAHHEPRVFNEKEVALIKSFADQAVIAIENVRLFDEVQARTDDLSESLQQQTATADVLKVISRSTFDLQVVLDTLTESAARLCNADMAGITRPAGGDFYYATNYNFPTDWLEFVKNTPNKANRSSAVGRSLLLGKTIHIVDVLSDPEYTYREQQQKAGFRSVLAVPLLREGQPIGVLALTRKRVDPFTDKQIELVSTFADQAVIAIENVRLFESVETRTRELAASLENLRTTQDRLVQTQKLASLGQLTAGIAHEIKNPLNFVNNFSGVSAELIEELQEALKDVSLNEKRRSEITELMDTLRNNLDKVVQHGQRADAIVKNMLLHSREGSGEHRVVDINALVEEGLNLAYHGARAEKQGFNIKLEKSFDPSAGEADVFPQDITRVLLNLISNGFYAATKRRAETNGGDYEPTLAAATKNRGDRVEITIRDNGTGIPADVKEKMFNPFFTTKPAGEGTGLGLSISHDIVVKQHGGSIEVETQPGEFTEIKIVLPRAGALPH
ncbi:MAG: GAF domain-containing protein [Pseudolabrys sp.]